MVRGKEVSTYTLAKWFTNDSKKHRIGAGFERKRTRAVMCPADGNVPDGVSF